MSFMQRITLHSLKEIYLQHKKGSGKNFPIWMWAVGRIFPSGFDMNQCENKKQRVAGFF